VKVSQDKQHYFLFGFLYFVQGAALAYFRNFQKPYLNDLGIDPARIGILTSILLLPFIIKIFIGMFSDKVSLFGLGHRKPYIIIGLFLGVLTFASVSMVSPGTDFLFFSVLIVFASFSVALYDSSTDGLAIDIIPPDRHGRVQGIMIGGRAVGFIILSLLFGFMIKDSNYSPLFVLISLLMLAAFFLAFTVKEGAKATDAPEFQWSAFSVMLKPHFMIFGIFAVTYSIISFGVDGLVTYYMSYTYQAGEELIGQYGALRGTGAVIGALAGGILMDRIGHKKIAIASVLVISLGAGFLGLTSDLNMVMYIGLIWGFAWGFQETVFVALAMSLADMRIAASMFAIMMALSNVGTAIIEGLATAWSIDFGFQNVFWLLGILNFINIIILMAFFKTRRN